MPDRPGTVEVLARELGKALEPLKDILGPDIAARLGLNLPPAFVARQGVVDAFRQGAGVAGELPPLIQGLTDAIDAGNAGQILDKGVALLKKVVALIKALQQIGRQLDTEANSFTFSAAEKAEIAAFAGKLAESLLHFVLVEYLASRVQTVTNGLQVAGILDNLEVTPPAGDALKVPYVEKQIHFDRILDLLQDPGQHLQDLYKWGAPDFDGTELLPRLEALLKGLGFVTDLYKVGPAPPVLEAYLLKFQAGTGSPPGLDVALRVPANFDFDQTFPLVEPWKLTTQVKGTFAAGVAASIRPPSAIELTPPSGTLEVEAKMGLKAQRDDGPMIFIGSAGGSRLESGAVGGSAGVKARWDSASGKAKAEPTVELAIEQGKLVIDLSEGDGFLQQILSGFGVEAGFDLKGTWNPTDGLQLVGSASIEVLLPVHVNLGVVEIKGIYVIGTFAGETPFKLELATELKANLGPLQAVVERMGVKIPMSFPDNGDGNLGPLDIGFGFRPPNGIGLSLDVGVVKGGGYLYLDFEKEEYAGALELVFSGFLTLKAIGLVTTRMPDGSKGFSLLIIITAEFGSGLQLGFGFVLLGVGGLLGLNRTMKLEPLMEGVRTGAIESVMFPEDVIANAPKIISDLRKFFPPQEGIFLIGPMAKLGWGTPALITVSLGIIIEIPGNIAILGILKVVLPDEKAPLLILQVNFAGAIEFDKKRLFFFAAMFESRVLFITLEGEMGLLVAWGDDANFVVSVGGFHPQFTPPPLPFPSPKRISFDILNQPFGRIRVMGYFAVTSNTVQLGARAELYFGLSALSVEGHLGFDALFQFNPFFFIIEISCGVSLKVFGVGLFSISLKFSLEGPTPWRAKGYGKLKLLFFSIKAKFDFTWGEKKDTSLPPIEVIPLLVAELGKKDNWTAQVPASSSLLVSLRALPEGSGALVLHPLGRLEVSQRAVPFDITLDKVGSQKPSDGNKFKLEATSGLAKVGDAEEKFAIAQFQDFKDSEKLSKPAFQDENAGLELEASGAKFATGKAVKRNVRYETEIIDSNSRFLLIKFFGFVNRLFTLFLGGNSVSLAAISHKQQKQRKPYDDAVAIQPEGYVVAFNADNRKFNGVATFRSEARAREYLAEQVATDPALSKQLHVIPEFELNQAA